MRILLSILMFSVIISCAMGQRLPIPGDPYDDLALRNEGWKQPNSTNGIDANKRADALSSGATAKTKIIAAAGSSQLEGDSVLKGKIKRLKKGVCGSIIFLLVGTDQGATVAGQPDISFTKDIWCTGISLASYFHESFHTQQPQFSKTDFDYKVAGEDHIVFQLEHEANSVTKSTLDILKHDSQLSSGEYLAGLITVANSQAGYTTKAKTANKFYASKMSQKDKNKFNGLIKEMEDLQLKISSCISTVLLSIVVDAWL